MTLENCVRFIPPPELCFMQCPHLPDCHWAAGASLSWLPGLNVHHACTGRGMSQAAMCTTLSIHSTMVTMASSWECYGLGLQ